MKRKTVLVSTAVLALLWPLEVLAHCHVPHQCGPSFVACWNNLDAQCAANFFEENADLSHPISSYAVGRTEIRRMLQKTFDGRKPGELHLELDPEPANERLFQPNLSQINWYASLTMPNGQKARLLLAAWLVPTEVSTTGEVLRHSFRSLHMILVEPARSTSVPAASGEPAPKK